MTQDSWISPLISGFISLFPCVSSCCVLLHSFLQIPSLCSIYFHLLWFETRRSVYPNNNEKQHGIVPCHTRAGFNHAGLLCSSLLRGSGSYCSSLPPSVVLTYNTGIRMQEPQISASIHMPSCSNLSRHSAPQNTGFPLGPTPQPCLPPSAGELCCFFSCVWIQLWDACCLSGHQMRLSWCLSCWLTTCILLQGTVP